MFNIIIHCIFFMSYRTAAARRSKLLMRSMLFLSLIYLFLLFFVGRVFKLNICSRFYLVRCMTLFWGKQSPLMSRHYEKFFLCNQNFKFTSYRAGDHNQRWWDNDRIKINFKKARKLLCCFLVTSCCCSTLLI